MLLIGRQNALAQVLVNLISALIAFVSLMGESTRFEKSSMILRPVVVLQVKLLYNELQGTL